VPPIVVNKDACKQNKPLRVSAPIRQKCLQQTHCFCTTKNRTDRKYNLLLDEICGYTVYKWRSELPFKVILLDRHSGDAKIVLAEGARLDYEVKRKYSFDIAAYDCQTGTHAPRYTMHTV